jgi:hypothetical protein
MTKRKKDAPVHRRDAISVRGSITCPSLNEGDGAPKSAKSYWHALWRKRAAPLGAPHAHQQASGTRMLFAAIYQRRAALSG